MHIHEPLLHTPVCAPTATAVRIMMPVVLDSLANVFDTCIAVLLRKHLFTSAVMLVGFQLAKSLVATSSFIVVS